MVSVLFNDSVFDLFIQEDAFDCNANLLHIGPKEWTRFSSNEQKVPCSSCAHVECFSCISDKERQRERVCVCVCVSVCVVYVCLCIEWKRKSGDQFRCVLCAFYQALIVPSTILPRKVFEKSFTWRKWGCGECWKVSKTAFPCTTSSLFSSLPCSRYTFPSHGYLPSSSTRILWCSFCLLVLF